jgi:hypothetical protein
MVAGGLAALLVAAFVLLRAPGGPRSLRVFAPDRMAQLELQMWQAYYRKEKVRLFALLVTMLHEQNRYSWARALQAGTHLARAAATFGDARSGYEQVEPDLAIAYRIARDWTGAGFDLRRAALPPLRRPGCSRGPPLVEGRSSGRRAGRRRAAGTLQR